MYTSKNFQGTYQDLAQWFDGILKNPQGTKQISKIDIIKFLHTKQRVPPGILKKYSQKTKTKKRITFQQLRDMTKKQLEKMMSIYIEKKGDHLIGIIDDIIDNNTKKSIMIQEVKNIMKQKQIKYHTDAMDIYKLLTVLNEKKYDGDSESSYSDSESSDSD